MKKLIISFGQFFYKEWVGGLILFLAALLAVVFENSSLGSLYGSMRNFPVAVQLGDFILSKPLLLWVNDGLMAIFFLLVGLELKREVLEGKLSSRDKLILPVMAALGGIIIPSLIYVFFNLGNSESLVGWAIPAATDIAFALGVLALFGKRVPASLKVFLVALAIIDDIAAILIIAFFYTANIVTVALWASLLFFILLVLLSYFDVRRLSPYLFVGLLLWVSLLKSGVHATLAGVVVAMFIPMKGEVEDDSDEDHCPLHFLEHGLHPWIVFVILPVFAFLNAGVSLQGVTLDTLASPISLGIVGGLVVGKPLGAFLFSYLAVHFGYAKLPENVNYAQLLGVTMLAGIGFTMSLFIGTLAFEDQDSLSLVRLGVIVGSLISGILGVLVLNKKLDKAVD